LFGWPGLLGELLRSGRFKLAGGIAAQAFLAAFLSARDPGALQEWWPIWARLAAFVLGGLATRFTTQRLPIFSLQFAPVLHKGLAKLPVCEIILLALCLLQLTVLLGLWLLPGPVGLPGHTGAITAVAISSDGAVAASGSEDRTIRLWSLTHRRELATLEGHSGLVTALAFSPDGSRLLSSSLDQSLRVWNVGARKVERRLRCKENIEVLTVAFFPDGERMLSGGQDATVRIWEFATGKQIGQLTLARSADDSSRIPTCLAVSPSGSLVAAGTIEGDVLIWRLPEGKLEHFYRGCQGGVVGLAFQGEEEVLAGSKEAGLFRWSLASPDPTGRWPLANTESRRVAFAPDGERALILRTDEVGFVLPLQTWPRRRFTLTGRCATWTPDGQIFVTGSNDRLWIWPARN
jgi:WD40 repeat protein